MASILRRNLDTIRLIVLGLVFCWLAFLPLASLYVNVESAHAPHLLEGVDRLRHDVVAVVAETLTIEPTEFEAVKGSPWSATLFGIRFTDPLAVVAQSAARLHVNWAFAATALVPLVVALALGRVFCAWVCPASFLYELVDRLRAALLRLGIPLGDLRLDPRIKYVVLATGVAISALAGGLAVSAIYPAAMIGRELNSLIIGGGFGAGAGFLAVTVLFDLLVARRGFCRYVCPGGALQALLGRYRLLRVQRQANKCVECSRCTRRCMFALDPMRDRIGQDCSNCAACVAVCPTGALALRLGKGAPGHG